MRLVQFSILFAVSLALLPTAAFASGLGCSVKAACGAGEADVLGLSSSFNAHAELPSIPTNNPYAFRVCCSAPVALGSNCATGTAFLRLSSATNAHVQETESHTLTIHRGGNDFSIGSVGAPITASYFLGVSRTLYDSFGYRFYNGGTFISLLNKNTGETYTQSFTQDPSGPDGWRQDITTGTDFGLTPGDYYMNYLSDQNPLSRSVMFPGITFALQPYPSNACISGTPVSCVYAAECDAASGYACLASISGQTNAHIGNCTDSAGLGRAYAIKVCCKLNDITAPTANLDWKGPTGDHTVGMDSNGNKENVLVIATASDSESGVSEVKLSVNGILVNTTHGRVDATWLANMGSVNFGDSITVSATVTDNAGNLQTTLKIINICSLRSVSVASLDCNSNYCDEGNKIRIIASFSGDTCPASPYVQVDASDSGRTCHIEASKLSADMQGLNASCPSGVVGGSCVGDAILPAVPSKCKSKTLLASGASLRDTLDTRSWRMFGYTDSAVGSFFLRGDKPVLSSILTSVDYVKYGGRVDIEPIMPVGTTTYSSFDCGTTSGGKDLCYGAAPSVLPICSFVANSDIWAPSRIMSVFCRLNDTTSEKVSDDRSAEIHVDNGKPMIEKWNMPAISYYSISKASIQISADVSDPPIPNGAGGTVPGSGVAACNVTIDSGTKLFQGSASYSAGRCSGALALNSIATGVEGMHTIRLNLTDMVGNYPDVVPAKAIVIDNTRPEAWVSVPTFSNQRSLHVSWEGTDRNSPDGSAVMFEVNYSVVDQQGIRTPWRTWNVAVGNGSAEFDTTTLLSGIDLEGKTIAFKVNATDQAGNQFYSSEKGTFMDTHPPACSLVEAYVTSTGNKFGGGANWFVNGDYTLKWAGNDGPGNSGSGIDFYEINFRPAYPSVWQGAAKRSFIADFRLGTNASTDFSCRAVDNAGNVGPWSENITVKKDDTKPHIVLRKLNEWMGPEQAEWVNPGSFRLDWHDSNDYWNLGSGIMCFFVQWKNSSISWRNISASDAVTGCITGGVKSYVFADTKLSDGENYSFRISALDNIGNAMPWDENDRLLFTNTTVDMQRPWLNYSIMDSNNKLLDSSYLDPATASGVSIISNASDNISGIWKNVITQEVIQRSMNSFAYDASKPSDCAGGTWNSLPNNSSYCMVSTDFDDGTTITYSINATDRANNTNSTQGIITAHPLGNFLVRLVVMTLGSTVDVPVQLRNLNDSRQTVRIDLNDSQFKFASFLPSEGLSVVQCAAGQPVNRMCASVSLSPGEQRTFYVRLMGNDVTNKPAVMEMNALSAPSGSIDKDSMTIIVGYPAEFPAFGAWWAFLLMIMLSAAFFYRNEL